jgi:hypothetical protein
MSQMTIYLDEESARVIRLSAKREHMSVSNWARRQLCQAARETWPDDFFHTFGALQDSDFSRPPQGKLGSDIKRQVL